MELLENIYKNILLEESVDISDINDAIDNHRCVIISYHTKGEDKNTGARVAEVYAYGLTEKGNPCIRVFQPYGDTTTRVPNWKLMRLDRISGWERTEQTFNTPANERYPGLGEFNPNGDETMSIVYKVAKFGNEQQTLTTEPSEPKSKQDVYRTSTEKNMERLNQQVSNPIKLSDIKVADAFRQIPPKQQDTHSGPKTKEDVYKPYDEKNAQQPTPNDKSPEEKQRDLEKLRNTLSDQPISLADLNKRMKEEVPEEEPKWKRIFTPEAEKDLEDMQKRDDRINKRRDDRWNKSSDSRFLNRKGSLNRV